MGQREDKSEWLSRAEQAVRMPVAWRYIARRSKMALHREWSDGAVIHPVYEMTAEDSAALNRTPITMQVGAITLRNPYLSR
jgi:hypothetical protein